MAVKISCVSVMLCVEGWSSRGTTAVAGDIFFRDERMAISSFPQWSGAARPLHSHCVWCRFRLKETHERRQGNSNKASEPVISVEAPCSSAELFPDSPTVSRSVIKSPACVWMFQRMHGERPSAFDMFLKKAKWQCRWLESKASRFNRMDLAHFPSAGRVCSSSYNADLE